MAGTFLTAEWRHLVMVNYEVDPNVLRPFVPAGTELDLWHGRALVSVVGFQFLRTRVLGVPIPFHRNFPEVNLRFYVTRETRGEQRRGVVFIKEIVPRWAVAFVARTVYHENYVRHAMREAVRVPGEIRYEWWHGGSWASVSARVAGEPASPPPGAEESFIAEHYWGYIRQPDGSTLEYGVEHPPWRVWPCTDAAVRCNVAELYGPAFAPFLAKAPASAFVADGSAVIVRRGVRLT